MEYECPSCHQKEVVKIQSRRVKGEGDVVRVFTIVICDNCKNVYCSELAYE